MNREDIIRMARDAGFEEVYDSFVCDPEDIERFAAIVEAKATAAEREACERVAGIALLGAEMDLAKRVLRAIRARGETK